MTLRHIDSRLPTNSVELGRVEDILSSIKTAVGRSATSPNILLRPRQSVPPQRRGGRLRGARPQEALRAGRAAGPWEPREMRRRRPRWSPPRTFRSCRRRRTVPAARPATYTPDRSTAIAKAPSFASVPNSWVQRTLPDPSYFRTYPSPPPALTSPGKVPLVSPVT